MSGRETLCIAVMSTTRQTWVLPPNGNPTQIFLLFLRESHQDSEFVRKGNRGGELGKWVCVCGGDFKDPDEGLLYR